MCTGIRLKAKDGAIMYARTLEFARDIASNIIIIPRNYSFTGITPLENQKGLQWKAQYAVVGTNGCGLIDIVDGVNECGMAGGLFYFPDYAHYQEITAQEAPYTIASWQLMTWILTNFATVSQVKKALPTIKVSTALFKEWGIILPIHAVIHDPTGQSLVIEYVQGKLILYDNPLGVLTNAPAFDWHNTNLRNYITLSPFNAHPAHIAGIILSPLGQGSGMLGIPGDFTSPSRFIRAAAFSQTALDSQNADEARDTAFHILSIFTIPRGSVRQEEDRHVDYEYTQWTSACDLQNKRYYFHTYDNRQLHMVDLMKANLTASAPTFVPMSTKQAIVDSTPHKGV